MVIKTMGKYAGFIAGSLLVISSILKVHQLTTLPFIENPFLESRVGSISLNCLEFILGFWLISSWKSHLSRLVAIFVFSIFFMVTVSNVFEGKLSCGCFGVLIVPPLYTAVIDLLVLIGLLQWRPKEATAFSPTIATLCTIALSISILVLSQYQPVTLMDQSTKIDEGEIIVIDEYRWIGKRFPLIEYIDGNNSALLSGDWEIILYRENCPECQSHFENSSSDQATAFIEVPPYKSPQRISSSKVVWLKLKNKHRWFVSTPAIIRLRNGIVLAAHND